MKKYLLFLITCIITSNSFSQENTLRISEIDKEIKIALLEEDYQKAADLKEEKTLLIEIDKALLNKDYQRAADLQEQLETGKVAKSKNAKKDRLSFESVIMKNGFIVEANLGGGFSGGINNNFSLGNVGLELGYRFYFGKGTIYRPGLQIIGLNSNILFNIPSKFVGVSLAPLNIGVTNLFEFSKDIGAELNVNLGYNAILDVLGAAYPEFITHGIRVNPELKFRYKQNAVGFDVSSITNFYSFRNNISTDNISLFSITYGRTF